ncbi:MAG TPA: transcription elongation factor GreA [Candidatus Coprosoma intestinipullorum]|uniref:Transcription elongation factor GreA n=1 Tax=Candidatus Coprosoma intestinipullorum TaxID=2840752 RepID=A0A9D0ZQD4_9FIRM|nr:transcription elongation factor GreA [Candidatus Coprosoma intestinipullorum]
MDQSEEFYVTEQGLADMKKELDYLKTEKRPKVIAALKEARALGDLSENAEYDAARSEQSDTENRIVTLEKMIENAIVIKEGAKDLVSVGSTVVIEYLEDGEKDEYTIVGVKEADPFANKISNASPIAKAILGHKQGETVVVASPNGDYKVKVAEIK